MKKKTSYFFCHSTLLDKFLTLKNANTLAFSSFNRNFALSLQLITIIIRYKEENGIQFQRHREEMATEMGRE